MISMVFGKEYDFRRRNKMMKKSIALIISLVLLAAALPCTAEEYPHDAYEWGMLEMYRQYLCRSNVAFLQESFSGQGGESIFYGIPEYDCSDFPTGIILDRDHRCVSVNGTKEILHLYLREDADADTALPVLAGFAYFQAYHSAAEGDIPAYELMNGEFREVAYEEAVSAWINAYVYQLDTVGLLAWSSNRKHEELIDDAIGRIRALWMGASGLEMMYFDYPIWDSVPDAVIFLDEDDMIMVQSRQSTLLIGYDDQETDQDILKGYVLFHTMMGGCEFYDMTAYSGEMLDGSVNLMQIGAQELYDLDEYFVDCVGW